MSATYNWSIRPGIKNRYNLDVPAGADDAHWSGIGMAYVALFGNDTTGNGSRKYPYRSPAGASNAGANGVILGAGTYRNVGRVGNAGYADGDVTFDNSVLGDAQSYRLFGINFLDSYGCAVYDSAYASIRSSGGIQIQATSGFQFSSVKSTGGITMQYETALSLTAAGNNTFIDSDIAIRCGNHTTPVWCSAGYFSIFDNCRISFTDTGTISIMDYCLFHDCQFRIGNSGDYTAITDLAGLLSFIYAAYPSNGGYTHCTFADPMFNNKSIGDLTLQLNSPGKNKSYAGTFVGAHSIAYPIRARADLSAGSFDVDSLVNATIGDDSVTLTDPASDARLDSIVIVNSLGRELAGLPVFGFNADRNGQYIDSIADLSGSTLAAGDTLVAVTPYLVGTGAITYNGSVYQPGQRLTTVSGVNVFTSGAGGTLQEILEAPQRHTLMARFSDGGAAVAAGDGLVAGNWYYVLSGSVTYQAVVYAAGQVFRASDTTAFSGTGGVILAMADESFQHYELGIKPTSNNAGDSRTGSIIRGNGDPAFVRGATAFPINAKFIQLRYIIKVTNLKP